MKNQDLQIKISSPVLKNIVTLVEDNPKIYVAHMYLYFNFFKTLFRNYFTGLLKPPVPKKQRTCFFTVLDAFIWVMLSLIITQAWMLMLSSQLIKKINIKEHLYKIMLIVTIIVTNMPLLAKINQRPKQFFYEDRKKDESRCGFWKHFEEAS